MIQHSKRHIGATCVAMICCMVFAVGCPSALAWYQSGERNDASMNGFWQYNWTYSYASCMARATACTVEAVQDQYKVDRRAAFTRNSSVTAQRSGIEQDTRDYATIY